VAGFVHLAAKSCYSLCHGVARPRELAEAAAARGMDALGVADRGGLYGAVRIAQACAAAGIRPILGADLALAPDPHRLGWEPGFDRGGYAGPGSGPAWLEVPTARVTLIAVTQVGYANLCRLTTAHHFGAARGDPAATWDQLARHREGLFVLLADESPPARLLDADRVDAAAAEARRWAELAGRQATLVGVTHHLAAGDDARVAARFALADRLGLAAVAHQAPRYLDPGDARLADVVDAIRQQVPVGPHHTTRANAEGYLKTPAQMAAVFAERPDALANAARVAESCHVELGVDRGPGRGLIGLPDFTGAGAGADAQLRGRCEAGLGERYPSPGQHHRDRLEAELDMITHLGLASYFLTVAGVVERIREKQIAAACRGSAAGSLVAYTLGISDVDPIAHGLCFERFANPYRGELPDIDIDVESHRRTDVYRDLLDRHGEDRVACVGMVETFQARSGLREVGKALGLPATELDAIAKAFPHIGAGQVRSALDCLPELAEANLDRADLAVLFDAVERLDGLPRHLALHPSGVLLADAELGDHVPRERSADGFAMAQFDKDDVEALGLCKLDVLGVRMLSAMSHAVEEARRVRGHELDLAALGSDGQDPATYELIRSTNTLGCFQIESPGQRELLGRFQPDRFGDLIVDISLFRPGPVKGDMIAPFLARRCGEDPRCSLFETPATSASGRGTADVPADAATDAATDVPADTAQAPAYSGVEAALAETYGVIVYHEQVMRCLAAATGCDLSTADLARRRLGDPEAADELRTWVVDGATAHGMSPADAEALWAALAQFASFGFAKAHAAAFAVPTYRSAWLKAHYTPELVAGLLTHDPGMYPPRLLLHEARRFGIAALPVDVNRSGRGYRVERVPRAQASALLGLGEEGARPQAGSPSSAPPKPASGELPAGKELPRGWRWANGQPLPPSGFDRGADPADPQWRFALRPGLQDVAGIDDAAIDSLLAGRPFADLADLRARSELSVPVAQSLAHVGALDELGGVTAGVATRRDVLFETAQLWADARRSQSRSQGRSHGQGRATEPVWLAEPSQPAQPTLLAAEPSPGLSAYRPSEATRAELEVVGLGLSAPVGSVYDGLLDALQATRAVELPATVEGQRIRVAGVKVATQTPAVKSGQRVIFLSVDDATGVADATFFESVHHRCAWTVFHAWLLAVEGVVNRRGERAVTVIAERAWDLRRLMHAWRGGWLEHAVADIGQPVALTDDGKAPAPRSRADRLRTPAARVRTPRNAPHGAADHHHTAEHDEEPPRRLWHASGGSPG
jgi:error-prone DNA polymerase